MQVLIDGVARVLCVHSDTPNKETTPEEAYPMVANERGDHRLAKPPLPGGYNAEWRIVASVIDRVFFLLYIVGITLALIFVFPR